MSLSVIPRCIPRWLRRPVLAASLLGAGLVAAAPAQAQYYPYYGYNPYYAAYCNPYYYPYGCAAAYADPYASYSYAYPYAGYAYPYAGYGYGYAAFGRGFGGFHHGFRGGSGFRGGGGHGGGRGGGGHGRR